MAIHLRLSVVENFSLYLFPTFLSFYCLVIKLKICIFPIFKFSQFFYFRIFNCWLFIIICVFWVLVFILINFSFHVLCGKRFRSGLIARYNLYLSYTRMYFGALCTATTRLWWSKSDCEVTMILQWNHCFQLWLYSTEQYVW